MYKFWPLLLVWVGGCVEPLGNPHDPQRCDTSPGGCDVDVDGYAIPVDCDDHNPDIHPDAVDAPDDSVDADCDGDDDEDGVINGEDCAPSESSIYPGADDTPDDLIDADCDGDSDEDGEPDGTDCDPANSSIHPQATDVPDDLIDSDCDGDSDEDGVEDSIDCVPDNGEINDWATEIPDDEMDSNCDGDSDGDGSLDEDDCEPYDPAIFPEATESPFDLIDSNCDGDSDGDGSLDEDDCGPHDNTIYPGAEEYSGDEVDSDCDGDSDNDGYTNEDDCDDTNPLVNPGGDEEVNDDIDWDCNADSDGDGSSDTEDCNDINPDISPNIDDNAYDTVDSDCDPDTDGDGDPDVTDCNDTDPGIFTGSPYEQPNDANDADCDGDGDEDGVIAEMYGGDDCDDSRADIFPGATETCDALDENCDGEPFPEDDLDEDGYRVCEDCDDTDPDIHPGAPDLLLDDLDSNCNGVMDQIELVVGAVDGAGNPVDGVPTEGAEARGSTLMYPRHIALSESGVLYIADEGSSNGGIIYRVEAGIITRYAGGGAESEHCEEGTPATNCYLYGFGGLTVSPRQEVWFTHRGGYAVYRIDAEGVIHLMAGVPGRAAESDESIDGNLANQTAIHTPYGIAVTGENEFYFTTFETPGVGSSQDFIYHIDLEGVIRRVAGSNEGTVAPPPDGTGVPALSVKLLQPYDILTVNNALLFTDRAGLALRSLNLGNGNLYTDYATPGRANVDELYGLSLGNEMDVYIAKPYDYEIIRLPGEPDRIAGPTTVNYSDLYGGDGGPATSAQLNRPNDVVVDPNGGFYIADTENFMVRRVIP